VQRVDRGGAGQSNRARRGHVDALGQLRDADVLRNGDVLAEPAVAQVRLRDHTEAVLPAPRQSGTSGLRVDAERNRQRVVTAAREVFAVSGLDVKIEEIARRAGVGVGTLYRRYPTRAELIAAAFETKMHAYAEAARQALADPDPWHGFCNYVEQICAMQAGDRGFTTVLTMTFPTAKRFEADRDQAFADFSTLVQRATDAGKLRQVFVTEDMPMFLMANAGVLTATADAAPDTWRRLIAYLLQACAAPAAQPLPDPPRHGRCTRPCSEPPETSAAGPRSSSPNTSTAAAALRAPRTRRRRASSSPPTAAAR
jgi:AcrR family transcriptional regulator